MTKTLFEDLEIGDFFKFYGSLYVKISYDRVDNNAFSFDVNYITLIEDDAEVEIVEKVEVTVKTPE